MAQPLIADLPRDLALSGDYVVRFTALSPTDGSTVSGVNVSNVVITAIDLATGQVGTFPGPDGALLPIYEMPGDEIP